MPHTYAQNVVHVVFSTKDRHKSLSPEFQPKLWAYVAGICKSLEIFVHAIGGIDDHIHLLIQTPPTMPLAKAVATIKSNSSRWANEQGHHLTWQQGYGAFSVSASLTATVVRYIQNQQSHHKKSTFDAEFLALLKKHNIPFDPQFVFG
jgi:REP-associated tyrosine transposase